MPPKILIVGGVIAVIIIIIIIIAVSGSGTPPPPPNHLSEFAATVDSAIFDTKYANASYVPPYKQNLIPAQYWSSTTPSTYTDCLIKMPDNVTVIDCTKDPMTLPKTSDPRQPGSRDWHVSYCSSKYGGDGVCKVGVPIGTGLPGVINQSQLPKTQCANGCFNDPNCALFTYAVSKSDSYADRDINGICTTYAKSAYPFRVNLTDAKTNMGIYTMYTKNTAAGDLSTLDSTVKTAIDAELLAKSGSSPISGYREVAGAMTGGGCYLGDIVYSDNPYYNPLTTWIQKTKPECASLCTNSSACKSFVHSDKYGCVLSGHPTMYSVVSHPTYLGLNDSSTKIKCGASQYVKL